MTSTLVPPVSTLLDAAADAAARGLTIGEPVTTSHIGPTAEPNAEPDAELSAAVVVPFSGAVTGEFAILIDEQIVATLSASAIGPVDLAVSLASAIDAIAAAIGATTTGLPQSIDARMATHRIANHADHGTVVLRGATAVRAAIAIGLNQPANGAAPPTVGASGTLDRLDLLRGVEMQASAELGRARMTINDLLSLRTGAVVELDRAAGDPADLFVNGRLIARGEVVVVDENYALRITQIVTDDTGR